MSVGVVGVRRDPQRRLDRDRGLVLLHRRLVGVVEAELRGVGAGLAARVVVHVERQHLVGVEHVAHALGELDRRRSRRPHVEQLGHVGHRALAVLGRARVDDVLRHRERALEQHHVMQHLAVADVELDRAHVLGLGVAELDEDRREPIGALSRRRRTTADRSPRRARPAASRKGTWAWAAARRDRPRARRRRPRRRSSRSRPWAG